MLRLPTFRTWRPRTLEEAVRIKDEMGPGAAYVAGGTDLLPNMKRGQQTPSALIELRGIDALGRLHIDGDQCALGAGLTLASLTARTELAGRANALVTAATGVATPLVRNMATLGGNVCLDTRCNYYDQSHDWRKGIGFCLKKDGVTCWVAPSSPRCWAVQSSDTAPVIVALGAQIELQSARGTRTLPAQRFYRDDGVAYLAKEPNELVTALRLPCAHGTQSTYLKVSRRAAFDFPVLGVAVWIRRPAPSAPIEEARIVLGALGSAPVVVEEAGSILTDQTLGPDTIAAAADEAWKRARPMDNTDQTRRWRKTVVRAYVTRALESLNRPDA